MGFEGRIVFFVFLGLRSVLKVIVGKEGIIINVDLVCFVIKEM